MADKSSEVLKACHLSFRALVILLLTVMSLCLLRKTTLEETEYYRDAYDDLEDMSYKLRSGLPDREGLDEYLSIGMYEAVSLSKEQYTGETDFLYTLHNTNVHDAFVSVTSSRKNTIEKLSETHKIFDIPIGSPYLACMFILMIQINCLTHLWKANRVACEDVGFIRSARRSAYIIAYNNMAIRTLVALAVMSAPFASYATIHYELGVMSTLNVTTRSGNAPYPNADYVQWSLFLVICLISFLVIMSISKLHHNLGHRSYYSTVLSRFTYSAPLKKNQTG